MASTKRSSASGSRAGCAGSSAAAGCLFDAARRPDRFNGTLTDVTDREEQREAVQAHARRAEASARLLRRLIQSTSIDESMTAVCEETAAALRLPFVTVRLLGDEAEATPTSTYAHGMPAGLELPAASRHAQTALRAVHGACAQFPSLADGLDLPNRQRYLDAGFGSLAYATMMVGETASGHVLAGAMHEARRLDPDEMEFLQSAAHLATVALTGARLADRYRRIVTGMSEGVALGDADGRTVFANPALEAMFGFSPGELAGTRVSDLWFPEDAPSRHAPRHAQGRPSPLAPLPIWERGIVSTRRRQNPRRHFPNTRPSARRPRTGGASATAKSQGKQPRDQLLGWRCASPLRAHAHPVQSASTPVVDIRTKGATRKLMHQFLELDPVRIDLCAEALFAIGLVVLVVPLEPRDLAVALEREDVRRDSIEEPAIVGDDHGAAGERQQRVFERA
jgi:PAS domain-containing protein